MVLFGPSMRPTARAPRRPPSSRTRGACIRATPPRANSDSSAPVYNEGDHPALRPSKQESRAQLNLTRGESRAADSAEALVAESIVRIREVGLVEHVERLQ